jgi:hypothetical protein
MFRCWSIEDRSTIFCVLYDCVLVDYDKLLFCANFYYHVVKLAAFVTGTYSDTSSAILAA